MPNRVAIINHGLCNLNSITRAVEECGGTPIVTSDPAALDTADRIILPGVGAFAAAMAELGKLQLIDALRERALVDQVPMLGICLGMQLLADRGEEGGHWQGLGMIQGSVVRLSPTASERVPHVGWNSVAHDTSSPLFRGLASDTDFYFVHSYHFLCASHHVIGRTAYCGNFVSAAANGSIFAVQFHPEKSQRAGFRLIKNFIEL